MNLIDKICATIKFKRSCDFIFNRIDKLYDNLKKIETNTKLITNQADDNVNWLLICESATIASNCMFSIEIIKGKINTLKPINQKQEAKKQTIIHLGDTAEKTYTKTISEFESNELVSRAKENLNNFYHK